MNRPDVLSRFNAKCMKTRQSRYCRPCYSARAKRNKTARINRRKNDV